MVATKSWTILCTLDLVNDGAKRSIKLPQDFSGKITEDDTECQDFLQSIEHIQKTKFLPILTKKQSFSGNKRLY